MTRRHVVRPMAASLAICAGLVVIATVAAGDAVVAQRTAPAGPQGAARARVVSLVPAVTEMLYAIGAGPQVVAVSSYDRYPPEVSTLPRVGALLDPDVERVLALKPTLVVSYGSQTALHAQLAAAGIAVFSYRHTGLDGILESIDELGSTIGRAAEARRVTAGIRSRLDAVRARVAGRPRPRTLLVFGRDPASLRDLYVSGGRGFLHDLLTLAGGANVFGDNDREAVQPSHELLLTRAPDVILEVRSSGMLEADARVADPRRAWTVLGSLPAVRSGRIQRLDGDYLVVPGPRVAAAAEALAHALHPEAFR